MARAHELEPANASYKFELERVRRILKDMPEPVIPLLTNQNGQPIITLENISRELELELRPVVLSKNDGKPIITLENHTIDPIQMQDLLYRYTKGAKNKLFNMDMQD